MGESAIPQNLTDVVFWSWVTSTHNWPGFWGQICWEVGSKAVEAFKNITCHFGHALWWPVFRGGPAGWGGNRRTLGLPRGVRDTWRWQGRNSPASFSFHGLISFFSSPIGWTQNAGRREGRRGNALAPSTSLAGRRAERRTRPGWMGRGKILLVMCISSTQALKIHLVIQSWLGSKIWLGESRKWSLTLGKVCKSHVFSTIFKVTHWQGDMTMIQRHCRRKCEIDRSIKGTFHHGFIPFTTNGVGTGHWFNGKYSMIG